MSSIQHPVSSIQKMRKRREKQLLIHCARTHVNQERISAVRRLLEDGDLDWNYILGNSSFYRIFPLLLRNLEEIADENTVPRSVMDTLAARYTYIFYRNMQIYSILRDILERFQNAGISVILLKGVALGETVYSDIDLRPPGDIDLLVKKTDLQDAADILLKMGYNPAYPMERYKNHHHIPPYKKLHEELNELISIEIHHNIAPEPLMSRIRAEELWEGAQMVNIAGIDALVLSPENLIMHLCIHLSYSCFRTGMGNLVDISQSIRHHDGNLNWDCIVGRSCRFGVSSFVYYPLCLAGEMMDANIPLYVVDKLRLVLCLKSAEEQFSRMIFKRNILTPVHSSFIYSFAEFTNIRLCKTLLYTSGIRNRAREIASLWTQALDKSIHN